jgi:Flp pilus assembly protein TadG
MMRPRTAKARRRDDDGAVAVEFALVFPILCVLVFAIIQYGMYFWAMQGGSAAAREAARKAAVGQPTDCDEFRSQVRTNIEAMATNTPTVTRTFDSPPGEVGDDVEVTVTFQSVDFGFPFVPFINNGVVDQSATARLDYIEDPATPPGNCP